MPRTTRLRTIRKKALTKPTLKPKHTKKKIKCQCGQYSEYIKCFECKRYVCCENKTCPAYDKCIHCGFVGSLQQAKDMITFATAAAQNCDYHVFRNYCGSSNCTVRSICMEPTCPKYQNCKCYPSNDVDVDVDEDV
jgi:hypothetical protein